MMSEEIEQQTVQTEQERIAAKQAAAPVERRAATSFWIALGRPVIEGMVTEWPKLMREAMGYLETNDLEEFKKFLHWTLEENPRSAEYLRVARDPCRSLVKNIESLKKFYLAWVKRQEIVSRKGKPLKPIEPVAVPQPENENGLVAGYTEEEIAAHAEACKLDPWVYANDSPAARKRPGFVRHLMECEPPKKSLKKVGGKTLPKYRQESGKNTILTGDV
jgi:hypothetical protein